jgi:hypothetical protein
VLLWQNPPGTGIIGTVQKDITITEITKTTMVIGLVDVIGIGIGITFTIIGIEGIEIPLGMGKFI